MSGRFLSTLALSLLIGAPAGAETSCHIHPAGSTPENPINTVGPYASPRECETVRLRDHGVEARCHCSADFTPQFRYFPAQPNLTPERPLI